MLARALVRANTGLANRLWHHYWGTSKSVLGGLHHEYALAPVLASV